jgi:hypothetical protein
MIEYNLAEGGILAAALVATLWITKRKLSREDIAYRILSVMMGASSADLCSFYRDDLQR